MRAAKTIRAGKGLPWRSLVMNNTCDWHLHAVEPLFVCSNQDPFCTTCVNCRQCMLKHALALPAAWVMPLLGYLRLGAA